MPVKVLSVVCGLYEEKWLLFDHLGYFFTHLPTGFTSGLPQDNFSESAFRRCDDCTLVSVVVDISSINRRVVFCSCPDDVVGPLVSLCADNTSIVIVRENRITLRVHPVMIPF